MDGNQYYYYAGRLTLAHWLILLAIAVLIVLPFWKIVGKAGFPPVLSVLFFIPVANIIFLWVLAFAEWPALRQRR